MSSKPAEQLWLPFEKRGELRIAEATTESPPKDEQLMERVVERDNLIRALKQVKRNGGSPRVDGMSVDEVTPKKTALHSRLHMAHYPQVP